MPTVSCFTSTKLSKEQSTDSYIKIIDFRIPGTGGSIQKSVNCFVCFVCFGKLLVCVDALIAKPKKFSH